MINSVSCFWLLLTSIGKSKWRVLSLVFITSRLLSIYIPIVIMTWLNHCKAFCWFCYADTKDILSTWFYFLVCMNYIQLLYVLIILEVWLIVSFELRFWFQFLFIFFFEALVLLFQKQFLVSVILNIYLVHYIHLKFFQLIYYIFNVYFVLYLIFKIDVF